MSHCCLNAKTTNNRRRRLLNIPVALDLAFNSCVALMMVCISFFYIQVFDISQVLSKYGAMVRDFDPADPAHDPKGEPIQSLAQIELIPIAKQAFQLINASKVFYILVLYVSGFETFYLFSLSHDEGFASSPLTVMLSLIDVGYLLVTSMVILIAVGGFVSLSFGGDGFLTSTSTFERLYSLFLGDLDILFDKLEENRSFADRMFFLVIFFTFTMVVTIVAFNIFMSIVIDAYGKAAVRLEERERERGEMGEVEE